MSEETVNMTETEATTAEYTVDDLRAQIKPLSQNGFVRAFQKLGRWWLGVWGGFSEKHPKGSSWLYKLFFFFVFSMGVTIWQALVMLFLPKAFTSLSAAFAWPGVQVGSLTWNKPIFDAAGKLTGEYIANTPAVFAIFGDEVLGNWIAFEIAVFTAQCINFPLQRNITYRSHGNPWYQAMWYFIGWVGISFLTGAIWGIIDPLLKSWGWFYTVNADGKLVENGILFTLATLLKTFITGGVSMIIFFPIFLIIFPDNNKMAKSAKAKYEKLVAANAPAEKIEQAKAKMEELEKKALLSNTDKDLAQASSIASAKINRYFNIEKIRAKTAEKASSEENAEKKSKLEAEEAGYVEKLPAAFEDACAAIRAKAEKQQAYEAARA